MLTGSSRTADSGRGEEMETDNNTNAIAIAPAEQPMDETREVLPNGTPGTSLDAEHSSEKIAEMGKQNADWLAKPVKMKKLFFGNTVTAKQLTFTVGNMGLIYRGNRCMRTAPFVCRTDQNDSNQAWAEFETHSFFGKGLSWWPWERASTKITYIPLKKTEDYMDTLNGDGFLMKFDEVSMSQLPMYVRYSKTKMAEIETDNRFIAQALLLKQRLQKLEKPKTNWVFLGAILVPLLIIALIAGFFLVFPNAWPQLTHWLGSLTSNLGSNLKPPGYS